MTFSSFKKLIEKDSITLTDVYDLVDDICDKVYVMLCPFCGRQLVGDDNGKQEIF